MGYPCERLLMIQLVDIDHRQTKHYRVACEEQGPHFLVKTFQKGHSIQLLD